MKEFRYENLDVWGRAVDFAVKVIELVEATDTGKLKVPFLSPLTLHLCHKTLFLT